MQEDMLIMSKRERKRKVILEDVIKGRISLKDAAPHLGVSYRQAKRQLSKYRALGDAGLVHGNRGKAPKSRYKADFKEQILRLYNEEYSGFGPTFAAEKLLERNNLSINRETLRLWLLETGSWKRRRKHKEYRKRRDARKHFGELLQIDGSDHHWFGKNRGRACLLNIVDDATTKTLSQLAKGETVEVLLKTFHWWIERYGVPKAVYVDFKNIYISQGRNKDGERVKLMNTFERVCALLDVEIIGAQSPQAKGRVERNHAVYQDRFVKELQLRGIKTIEEGNVYLREEYLDKINQRFEKQAASKEDAHCSVKAYGDLDQIFCWVDKRCVQQDWTFRFENRFYQIEMPRSRGVKPKDEIEIRRHLDGRFSYWYGETRLNVKTLQERPKRTIETAKSKGDKAGEPKQKRAKKSPWRQFNPNWIKRKKSATPRQQVA